MNQRTDDAALAAIIEPVPLATFRAWEQWARPTAPPWDSFAVKSRQHRELRYVLEGWNEFPRPEVWQLAFERSRIGTGPGKLRSGASGLLPALRAAAAELLARLPRPSPARAEACQSGGCGAKATFHAPDGGQLCGSHAKAIVDRGGLRWEELAEIGPTTSYGPRKCRPAPV